MKTRRILKKALSVALCAVLLGGTAVMLPAVSSEVSVCANAYQYNDFDYTITADNKVSITKYRGESSSITIPSNINGRTVTEIGESAFYYNTKLQSVTIPYGVKKIGDSAFSNCMDLKSISIPNSVTSIGDEAFFICYNLTSVTIPNGVTYIGKKHFSDAMN